jgi:hypothetical protein
MSDIPLWLEEALCQTSRDFFNYKTAAFHGLGEMYKLRPKTAYKEAEKPLNSGHTKHSCLVELPVLSKLK